MSRAFRYLRVSARAWHEPRSADDDCVGGSGRRGWWDGHGRVEQAPDSAGEVSFEAADRFSLGFAFAVSAVEIRAGRGVGPGAGERDDVQGAVELAVAAAVQAVALGVAGAGGNRCSAGVASEARVGREPFGAAVWPMMIAAVMVPQPCSASSCGQCASISALTSASSSPSSR